MARPLSIGQLSERTGSKVQTIRYYEQVGLLKEPLRTGGGQRLYDEAEVRPLLFIRRSRELGFSLEAVRSLLGLASQGDRSCREIDVIASEHLQSVTEKLRLLSAMRDALGDLLQQCQHTVVLECRIVEALSGEPGPVSAQLPQPLETHGSG